MTKKASLQLSINAIVIIILAITLLGLGLTFIRQFLGAGSEEFMGIIENTRLKNPATVNQPMTIDREIVLENSADPIDVYVGFYCDSASECTGAVFSLGRCSNPLTGGFVDGNDIFDWQAVSENIAAHEATGFIVLLKGTGVGTYTCIAKVDSAAGAKWKQEEQITIVLE